MVVAIHERRFINQFLSKVIPIAESQSCFFLIIEVSRRRQMNLLYILSRLLHCEIVLYVLPVVRVTLLHLILFLAGLTKLLFFLQSHSLLFPFNVGRSLLLEKEVSELIHRVQILYLCFLFDPRLLCVCSLLGGL